jgi:hypothetical protein
MATKITGILQTNYKNSVSVYIGVENQHKKTQIPGQKNFWETCRKGHKKLIPQIYKASQHARFSSTKSTYLTIAAKALLCKWFHAAIVKNDA